MQVESTIVVALVTKVAKRYALLDWISLEYMQASVCHSYKGIRSILCRWASKKALTIFHQRVQLIKG